MLVNTAKSGLFAPQRPGILPHAHRHLERQFDPPAHGEPAGLAWPNARPTSSACRRSSAWTRPSRARSFEGLGYNVAVHGQKAFNGVALLSKLPFDEVAPGLIGDDGDVQARFLEAIVSTKRGVLRVVSLYLPNGNPPDTEKYPYKLKWMERLIAFSRERLKLEEPFILAGDYNVIPAPADARNPAAWVKRRAVPAADAGEIPRADQSRPHRRHPRGQRRRRPLHVLGLPGRRLRQGQRHPYRPSAAVAAGGRPADRRRHRPPRPRLGQAVRSRAGVGRSGYRGTLTKLQVRCANLFVWQSLSSKLHLIPSMTLARRNIGNERLDHNGPRAF